MSELTATSTPSIYAGPYLKASIAQTSPLKLIDGGWEATLATRDQKYEAKPIYKPVVYRMFQQLVDRWTEETLYMSSVVDMVAHPTYLEIIAMGETAVPLLLRELEKKPNHWFAALRAITGENPIPEKARGRLKEMTESWLEWGRENNYF